MWSGPHSQWAVQNQTILLHALPRNTVQYMEIGRSVPSSQGRHFWKGNNKLLTRVSIVDFWIPETLGELPKGKLPVDRARRGCCGSIHCHCARRLFKHTCAGPAFSRTFVDRLLMMIKDFISYQLRGETRLKGRLGKEGDQELEAGGKPWWIEMYGWFHSEQGWYWSLCCWWCW